MLIELKMQSFSLLGVRKEIVIMGVIKVWYVWQIKTLLLLNILHTEIIFEQFEALYYQLSYSLTGTPYGTM